MAERPFFTPYAHDFVRVGACTPAVAVADPAANARSVLELVRAGAADGARVLVFPELCLTAYAVDDLHLQAVLLEAAEAALAGLIEASLELEPLFVVGLPVRAHGRLYNAAAAVHRGRLLAVTPKTFLPNYREFYERRWFASGAGVKGGVVRLAGREAPFGSDALSWPILKSARTSGCPSRRRARRPWPGPNCCSTFRPPISPSPRPRRAGFCASPSRPGAWPPTSMRRRGRANRPPTWPSTGRRACSSSERP
jgi:hypothetical protein